ncbi:MAG: methyltransferase [Candidatus Taylorbacteria bacterium CG10_big_fil_rev_8_21_14_0_10_41_48]|uniref:Methyltransferase n=1 Tax=Candidatus Taylorbacteria bacterium CG10_big_fil_rev_8_21_14_0_10_41_48 TaxID=1975024 RepID=A0A2M8LB95_9BACT|nr:MAG: methyltransferase [Candidatus Taylorbacteria bacterium CG10_big_fil_rev_8_21_14_0_10_41_48]
MNVTTCHLCGSSDLAKVLDLGFHPLADFFMKKHQIDEMERRYPLSVLLCRDCGHGMNSYVVPAETRYQENDYSYDSSNSRIAIQHFVDMAKDVTTRARVGEGDLVVDIGSNVGTLLSAFRDLGAEIQGVDPATNIAALATKSGIPTINDFFGGGAAKEILKKGKPKAVTMTNAFNHVSHLDSFMKALLLILPIDGVFVIELPYFLEIIEKKHFDVIYLEHVSYIAIKPLARYFKKFDLSILHAEENDYMSGSIRIFVGYGEEDETVKEQIIREERAGLFDEGIWAKFAKTVLDCKLNLLKELVVAKASGGKIVAIGAAAKGNTLLNYCGIDATLIDFATDASPLKIGKYTPGSHLPILSDDAIGDDVTHALILAWNIADFLKEKISPVHPKLAFITPHVVE